MSKTIQKCQYDQPAAIKAAAIPRCPAGVDPDKWAYLLAWGPKGTCPTDCWPAVRPLALQGAAAVLRAFPDASARHIMGTLAMYLHDALHRDDRTGTLKELLDERLIEGWVEQLKKKIARQARGRKASAQEISDLEASLGTYRARLRRVAEAVGAQQVRRTSLSRTPTRTVYSPAECDRLLQQVNEQSTPQRRRGMEAVLLLGLGVGAWGFELAETTGAAITRDECGVVWVEIPGVRARTVPCDTKYATALFELGQKVGEAPLIAKSVRPSTVSDLMERLVVDAGLPLETKVLCNTWRARRLDDLQIQNLLDTAGVKKLDAFDSLLGQVARAV